MTVGRHVPTPGASNGLPLLAAGVVVSEAILERMTRAGVATVWVDDDLSDGIEPIPPITDELRRSAVGVVREAYAAMRTEDSHVLPSDKVAAIESTMNAILTEISSRKNMLVCLSDLNVFGGDRMQIAINTCVVGCTVANAYFAEHGWLDFRGNRRDDRLPERLQKLGMGLLLQDIGTLAVPESVRDKGGLLTAEERALMQQHPTLGVEMLESGEVSPLTKVTIAQHHEKFDGSGYPRAISGDEIHDHGSIAAIAETFVGLTYRDQGTGREPMPPHLAWQLVANASGRLFRPDVVTAFTETIAPYGPGAVVRLTDGMYAIIVKNTPAKPLHPSVRIVADADGLLFEVPRDVDLAAQKRISVAEGVPGLPTDRIV
jgi:hypothetical protein